MSFLLHDYLTRQVQKRPEATAIAFREARLTYGELEDLSSRLCFLLTELGCGPGNRVGLFLPKSIAAVAGMLAVSKAGAIYVPVDLKSPAHRLARIVNACEPQALLLGSEARSVLDEMYRENLVETRPKLISSEPCAIRGGFFETDGDLAGIEKALDRTPHTRGDDATPAHILFTSGSTGEPKGVMVSHRNVRAFVDWAVGHFGIEAGEKLSGHSPLYFDLSTFDIYGTLAAGAELHLVPPQLNLLPTALVEFMAGGELTQWFSVPSALTYIAKSDALRNVELPFLKRVLSCGDVLPAPTVTYWMERLANTTITNLYGPTETTIASSYYTVPRGRLQETGAVPIGEPCGGEGLYVLDDDLQPTPPGVIGDLYIRGAGVTLGYWRDDEKSKKVFVSDPFRAASSERMYRTGDLARRDDDGLLHFVGRRDSQIKSRGHRIELGEIQTALYELDVLETSAVVAVSSDDIDGQTICCAYVPASDDSVSPAAIKKELGKKIPRYMIPSRWKVLDSLPTRPNGKVDYQEIREMFVNDATRAD